MKIRELLSLFIFTAVLALAAPSVAGDTAAPKSNQELKQAFASGKKTVIFFLNPMGAPCRAQNDVLQKLHADRAKKFNIVNIDATRPSDQKVFYDYGVRGLPSIVIVDSRGNIGRVFPPGVQSYETLAHVLDSIK
ncbi:MAG: hypothetical protein EPN22_15315 [Nitrospirae bacterium]|nr:MAG: hypothetical protein EPN22_15315 [Nitrospirota bacterium]